MLKQFASNVYSQNGEDGILQQIFERLEIANNPQSWCVEFGAWDGVHLSNTYNLVQKGWSSVMIEGDSEKYKDLLETAKKYTTMQTVEAYVSRYSTEENSLDKLLGRTSAPKELDFLSIDVDSYDSDIWETLENYSAKVVCVEINSSIPVGIYWRHGDPLSTIRRNNPDKNVDRFINTWIAGGRLYEHDNELFGLSTTFSETLKIANSKEYTLVCHTGNGIFVKNNLVHKLNIPPHLLENQNLLFWGA